MNIQDWFPLGLTGLTFWLSNGLSRFFPSTIVQKHQFHHTQPSLGVQLSHPYMTIGKTTCVSCSVMSNSATPWTIACQALRDSPGKNTGMGCHYILGDLHDPGMEPGSPALQADSLLSQPAGETIALTTWTFVGKVMSLVFNMLSRVIIAFLPRSKCFILFIIVIFF